MKKIEKAWKNYSIKLAMMGFTSEALVVSRKMFYSGAISLMNILTEGEPEEKEELHDVSELVEELKMELNEFSEEDQKIRLYKPNKKLYRM